MTRRMTVRRGFTLVELLVVVAIIGILAGLIMVGGSAAFRAARESSTRMEMTNLERALEMYKTKYGEYPPDFSDYDAFVRHFKKRWPRVDFATYFTTAIPVGSPPPPAAVDAITLAITTAINVALTGVSSPPLFTYAAGTYTFDADLKLSAIAFWLGGLPDPADSTTLIGFGPSDNPFCLATGGAARDPIFANERLREKPLYEFSTVLRNLPSNPTTDGYHCLISGKPVAYFRGTTLITRAAKTSAYLQDRTTAYNPASNPNKQVCILEGGVEVDNVTPYALRFDPTTTPPLIDWHNANSFQLIHPGADGLFSDEVDRSITVTDETTQTGLKPADLDNITNCGSAATIQGIIGK